MATPRYIVQKVGEEYVTVPADGYPQMNKVAYSLWGGLIAFAGLRRGGLLGVAMAAGGGWMAYTALQGKTPSWSGVMSSFSGGEGGQTDGPSYPQDFRGRSDQAPSDRVDEMSMESFPASDPPAKTANAATPA